MYNVVMVCFNQQKVDGPGREWVRSALEWMRVFASCFWGSLSKVHLGVRFQISVPIILSRNNKYITPMTKKINVFVTVE
jgi:hypothetical protein